MTNGSHAQQREADVGTPRPHWAFCRQDARNQKPGVGLFFRNGKQVCFNRSTTDQEKKHPAHLEIRSTILFDFNAGFRLCCCGSLKSESSAVIRLVVWERQPSVRMRVGGGRRSRGLANFTFSALRMWLICKCIYYVLETEMTASVQGNKSKHIRG